MGDSNAWPFRWVIVEFINPLNWEPREQTIDIIKQFIGNQPKKNK